jgi:hypothetical protein
LRHELQPFLDTLRTNTSLKKLHLYSFSLSDEPACGALRGVFAKNTVLEELSLCCGCGSRLGDTDLVAWRNTLPFLRDNKTLKSLKIRVINWSPPFATFYFDMVAMLKDNKSLECLDLKCHGGLRVDSYFTALETLQHNTALKTLLLHPNLNSISEDGEMKRLISIVKKNYGLQSLDEDFYAHDKTGELHTILRLNQAGRRYLIEDAGSISSGVEVLITVSEDLDCLFYHLLENPLLCDIEHQGKNAATIAHGDIHINKRKRPST